MGLLPALIWGALAASPGSGAGGTSLAAAAAAAQERLPSGVVLVPSQLQHRGAVAVVQADAIAPTGLRIADRPRWWVHGDVVRWIRPGTPVTARSWARPTRSPDQVRAAVRAAGVVVETDAAVVAEHRPDDGTIRWRVQTRFDLASGERPMVWVEDDSGEVTLGPDLVRRVDVAAYARNPVLDEAPTVFAVDSLPQPEQGLAGTWFDAVQCGDPGAPGACVLEPVLPAQLGDFVFDGPQNDADHARVDDPFAAASIYAHADRYARFVQAHGLPLPPCIEEGGVGVLLANYRGFTGADPILVANAGYTGDCGTWVFFGQGPAADWGYDADVIVHELAHGTIDALMGPQQPLLGTRRRADGVLDDAGAVGEAIADFMAAVVSGDPDHAEYVAAYDGGPMRSADNALRCPDDLVGEIHFDGEPLTGALWEAYTELGEDVIEPVLLAVAMLEPDTTFEETSAAIVAATDSMLGPSAATTMQDALEGHGLLDCERVAAIDAVAGPLWLEPRFGVSGYYTPMRPPHLQVRVDVPGDATQMTVTYDVSVVPQPGWEPVGDVHVLVKQGAAVQFSYSVDADDKTTVDADSTAHVASANEGTFTLDVEPGTPVFLAFFNQGLHLTRVGGFAVTFEGTDAGDTGESTGTAEGSGTSGTGSGSGESSGAGAGQAGEGGCRVAGPSRSAWLCLLMFAWAGSQTRRRRCR